MIGDLRFWNHACVEIELDEGTLLCDPWFFGRVFNDSWELLHENDPAEIDWSRVRYLWISHEHPDHLHFGSLRRLRELAPQRIEVLFRRQPEQNVVKSIRALGFEVSELPLNETRALEARTRVYCLGTHADSALLIDAGGRVIFNQNDCRLGASQIERARAVFGAIDVWLFQFSLAGYYGNEDDNAALGRAGRAHLTLLARYLQQLRPRAFVPFASFVRFCHPRNQYLNAWRVSVDAVREALAGAPARVHCLAPGEVLHAATPRAPEADDAAAEFWRARFDHLPAPEARPRAERDDAELIKAGQRLARAIRAQWPRWTVPGALSIHLDDIARHAVIDLRRGEFGIASEPGDVVIAAMDSQTMTYMFRFPWGADTAHISSTVRVIDDFRWRWLLYVRHADYRLAHYGRWRTLVPLPLAAARGWAGRVWHRKG